MDARPSETWIAKRRHADGRLLREGPDENSDLFWALRGGGGNFGVVTSFEFRTHPLGHDVWFSVLLYPFNRAEDGMRFFLKYMKSAPEELGGIAVYWSVPAAPEIPQELHGEPVLIFLACYHGPFEEGEKIRTMTEFAAERLSPIS